MVDEIRLSPQTLTILAALLENASDWHYGYDLSRRTELKSGTLYPILMRLAERKWLETKWQHAEENGKPRHMYRLTSDGRKSASFPVRSAASRQVALRPALRER